MEWVQTRTTKTGRRGNDDDSGGYERHMSPFLSKAGSYSPKSCIFLLSPPFSIFLGAFKSSEL